MQVSAEHPLVGNDADNQDAQDEAPSVVCAKHENEQISPRNRDMSFAFRFEPPGKKTPVTDHDDGPIIRRIDGLPPSNFEARRNREMRTPRMFPQQPVHTEATSSETAAARVPAMEESLLGDQPDAGNTGSGYRPQSLNFSVSAIRAQRMRRPAGARKSSSIVAKMTIATFIGITCVSSGVTLGLYGPELAYRIESQVKLAGTSLSSLLSWPGSDTSGQKVQVSKIERGQSGTTSQTATTRATNVGYRRPVAQTGAKIFYDRIPPSKPSNSAILKPVNAAAANLTGLAKHLAVPDDLQSISLNRVSTGSE